MVRRRTKMGDRRTGRKLLIGGAVAALLLLGACDGGGDTPTRDQPTGPPEETADPTAEEIATGFVEAYGAFDAEQAISYLADDAALSELITSLGGQEVSGTPEELRLFISMLEAQGYEQMLDQCEETSASASGTVVGCTFEFHLFGSDELGFGPFNGSSFTLTVRDGVIVRASKEWGVDEFSPQVWEPFAEWVAETYPDDAAAMYTDETYGGVRLTEESVRLWRQHIREYAKEMAR